jgi:hypothetical protein
MAVMLQAASDHCAYQRIHGREHRGRNGILPRDADRVHALLQEAGLVDHQHAAGVAQRGQRLRSHQMAQLLRVLAATSEQRL